MTYKRLALFVVGLVVLGVGYRIVRRLTDVRELQNADKALFLTGDFEAALANYTNLIARHPEKAGLYYKRGDTYAQLDRSDEAIADYKSALRYGIGDSLQTLLRMGTVQKSLGHWDTAKNTFQELLSNCDQTDTLELWAAHYHLGQVEYKLNNYRGAIAHYLEALEFSKSKLTLYHRANAYAAIGLRDSAVADYNASIAFAKYDYVRANPTSSISRCDTCGFSFGSLEYDLLTERSHGTILQSIQHSVEEGVGGGDLQDIKEKLENAAQ